MMFFEKLFLSVEFPESKIIPTHQYDWLIFDGMNGDVFDGRYFEGGTR